MRRLGETDADGNWRCTLCGFAVTNLDSARRPNATHEVAHQHAKKAHPIPLAAALDGLRAGDDGD